MGCRGALQNPQGEGKEKKDPALFSLSNHSWGEKAGGKKGDKQKGAAKASQRAVLFVILNGKKKGKGGGKLGYKEGILRRNFFNNASVREEGVIGEGGEKLGLNTWV